MLRRRWYQFSLRTFFVLVTIACVAFGYWVHWCREWIRQRHEAISSGLVEDISVMKERPRAPGGLWLFQEQGLAQLHVESGPDHRDWKVYWEKCQKVRRLFPEATFFK